MPIDAIVLAWRPDGRLVATSSTTFATLSGDGPAATWVTSPLQSPPRSNDALIVLSDGVTLMGSVVIDRSPTGLPPWTRVCQSQNGGCYGPLRANAFFELPPGHAHAGRVLAGNHNYSDDRGLTWTAATDPYPTEALNIADFALLPSGRILAAGAGWGLVSSDDGGASWQASPVYLPYRYSGYGITALATPGSVQSGNPSCGLPDLSLCEGALAIGTDAQDAYNRTWWTNDGGRSWRQGEPLVQLYDGVAWGLVGGVFDLGLDAATGLGRSVAVLGRGFVFATRDGGQTWAVVARVPILPPDADVRLTQSAVLDGAGRLYVAVTYNGSGRDWVYRTTEPVTAAFAVAGEAGPDAAPGVGLSVRPNPSTGAVSVRLGGVSGAATVAVYDALGRRVAVLHDGALPEGGLSVSLDGAGLPAGVYVVHARVTAAGGAAQTLVQRVTLTR